MKISRKLAAEVAKQINRGRSWASLRDQVDARTYGELDAWKLDKLTDWVAEEHKRETVS